MKRRFLVLAVCAAVVTGLLFLLVRAPVHAPEPAPNKSEPRILDDPDFFFVADRALDMVGITPGGLVGNDWRGVGCRVHSYLFHPQNIDARPIFATRDLDADEIKVITADQFDAMMRQHISFDGGFVPATFGAWGDMYYWLGRMPDTNDSTHIYIRFDQTACGLVVDRIWYRGYPKGSEYVDVRISVLP